MTIFDVNLLFKSVNSLNNPYGFHQCYVNDIHRVLERRRNLIYSIFILNEMFKSIKMEKRLTNRWILFLIIIPLFFSCNKKANDIITDDNVLIGTWADTVSSSPGGYYIYELVFDKYDSFTDKSDAYGIYNWQHNNELSGWYMRTGNFTSEGNKISFSTEKAISWDSFFGGNPITTTEKQVIFINCTFKISNDTLELSYITFPADGPENTIRKYKKRNN